MKFNYCVMASDTKSFDLEKLNLAVSSRNVPEFYKLVIILKKVSPNFIFDWFLEVYK